MLALSEPLVKFASRPTPAVNQVSYATRAHLAFFFLHHAFLASDVRLRAPTLNFAAATPYRFGLRVAVSGTFERSKHTVNSISFGLQIG